jgi:hypothetical protein
MRIDAVPAIPAKRVSAFGTDTRQVVCLSRLAATAHSLPGILAGHRHVTFRFSTYVTFEQGRDRRQPE